MRRHYHINYFDSEGAAVYRKVYTAEGRYVRIEELDRTTGYYRAIQHEVTKVPLYKYTTIRVTVERDQEQSTCTGQ